MVNSNIDTFIFLCYGLNMKKRFYKHFTTALIFLSGFLFYNMISFAFMPKLNTEDGFECAMIYNYAIVSNSALKIKAEISDAFMEQCKQELAMCEERE